MVSTWVLYFTHHTTIISPKMAPKPYIEKLISKVLKHRYSKSSYRNSSYQNIDIKNIEPPNHMEPKSLKFHIKPSLMHQMVSKLSRSIAEREVN